jgi:hypothetical protein
MVLKRTPMSMNTWTKGGAFIERVVVILYSKKAATRRRKRLKQKE